ncbi:chemotaxis protein CheX [Psychrobacter jeotgali]|uniref:chemotaxis protein CheX n=1 Tax=Psychrobacter jeotgali TaxID=179010 RepID=UPI00191AB647|nr:chemotaxis protein CheX [Psychrobacter jeotgali]
MKEQKLQVFLDIISHYFQQFANDELIIDTPYLLENKQPKLDDYTGIIGISGIKKGVVCFTATHELLSCMLDGMEEKDKSDDNLVDLVGEVANTVAGNARNEFGTKFHISVPLVFKGAPQSMVLPKDERSFIIPIMWRAKTGQVIICLQD